MPERDLSRHHNRCWVVAPVWDRAGNWLGRLQGWEEVHRGPLTSLGPDVYSYIWSNTLYFYFQTEEIAIRSNRLFYSVSVHGISCKFILPLEKPVDSEPILLTSF